MATLQSNFLKLKIKTIFFILLFSFPLFGQDLGSFYVLKNTNAYHQPDSRKGRVYIKRNGVYKVENMSIPKKGQVSLQLLLHLNKKKKRIGYIFEKKKAEDTTKKMVKVFQSIPVELNNQVDYELISFENINFINVNKNTSYVHDLNWYKITYIQDKQKKWVKKNQGIYRSDKSLDELQELVQQLEQLNLTKNEKKDIISGTLRVGYSEAFTKMALGEPIKIKEDQIDGTTVWQYQTQDIVFQFKKIIDINHK